MSSLSHLNILVGSGQQFCQISLLRSKKIIIKDQSDNRIKEIINDKLIKNDKKMIKIDNR